MSVATASKTAACERLYLVDYARGRHRYLYSFSEFRLDEVLEVIRGQGDDPEYPMSDMDCLRLLNAVKMGKLLAVGGCMDASGSYAHCFVYCVGVAKPAHVPAHGTGQVDGFGAVESTTIKGDSGSSLAGDIGAGGVSGCFILALGCCFWAFIALSVFSAVLGLNLLVSLFSLFAGR